MATAADEPLMRVIAPNKPTPAPNKRLPGHDVRICGLLARSYGRGLKDEYLGDAATLSVLVEGPRETTPGTLRTYSPSTVRRRRAPSAIQPLRAGPELVR